MWYENIGVDITIVCSEHLAISEMHQVDWSLASMKIQLITSIRSSVTHRAVPEGGEGCGRPRPPVPWAPLSAGQISNILLYIYIQF